MKKSLKIIGITLLSIIGVVLIVVSIACYVVFTPERLTPIVRNNAHRIVTCQTELEQVDLTFFSTFPRFALQISNIQLINPTEGAATDTLLAVETISATVNVTEFLFHNNVVIDQLLIKDGVANLFTDSTGTITNYDIMVPSEEETDSIENESSFSLNLISLNSIAIKNLNASYIDLSSGIDAKIRGFETTLNGEMEGADAEIQARIAAEDVEVQYNDSTIIGLNLNKLELTADGNLKDNHFIGDVNLALPNSTFVMDNDTLLNQQALTLNAPLEVNLDIMHIALKNSLLAINEHKIAIDGPIQLMDSGDINMEVTLTSNVWDIEEVLQLVPESYSDILTDFKRLNGSMDFSAQASGTYNDSVMPIINAKLNLNNGEIIYSDFSEFPLRNVSTTLSAIVDMNNPSATEASIHTLHAETGSMSFDISGSASNVMDDPYCDINLKGNLNLPELKSFLPDDMNVEMTGRTNANITAKFLLSDAMDMKLNRLKVNGSIAYNALDVVYEDSMKIRDTKGVIELKLPSTKTNKKFKELGEIAIKGSDMNFEMVEFMNVDLTKPELGVRFGDFNDTTQFYTAYCTFGMDKIVGAMDTINFDVEQPSGTAILSPAKRNKKNPSLTVSYASNSIDANMGSYLNIDTKRIAISATTVYNDKEESMLLKWNPTINVDFNDGNLSMADFGADISIPAIKFVFRPDIFTIDTSRIVIGESDFNLSGEASNLRKYLKKKDLLVGDFYFISDNTNIDELMDLVNGFGGDDAETTTSTDENVDYAAATATEATTIEEEAANPFMVPKGINIGLTTKLRKANFSGNLLEDINGKLTVRDGVIVAEQMGFTSDAAKMQVTGMYRSDRTNHLFCGVDFHLLDIDIKKLIEMIPSIDTIVPMLKSFDGKAEFHLAAETYLDAYYNLKMSTLRGAAALEGKDLVLMDSELFSTISKYMMFSKKTENVIDSLSVEMTVFRSEVDLYPFLISMDKWQAVLSGRHNLDMNFDYHISLTDCPLPARLGLDVKGNFDDMKFNLVPCKYKDLYKPEKAGVTEKQILSLKNVISDSLKKNVKEETLEAVASENNEGTEESTDAEEAVEVTEEEEVTEESSEIEETAEVEESETEEVMAE